MTTENIVDQTVFSKEADTQSAAQPATPGSEYVGEGKKYATADLALASIAPSQDHIKNLEAELATSKANYEVLQEDLKKRETAEEIISRINPAQPDVAPPAQTVDLESIKQTAMEAALNALTVKESDNAKLANEKLVSDSLKSTYGDGVDKAITEKMVEVGMDIASMRALSQNNPRAVLAMFKQSQSIDMPTKSSNGSSLSGQLSQKPERVAIMGASTSADLVSEWQRCKDLQ